MLHHRMAAHAWFVRTTWCIDVQIRGRLHQLNGRLSKVETQVQLIEQTLSSVDQQDAVGNDLER